jgi:hypothetical protein
LNDHPLCCDCESCLNGAGGYTVPGAGVTKPDPSGVPQRTRQYGLSWLRSYPDEPLERRAERAVT